VSFPSTFGEDLKEAISNLLVCDLSKRYGNLKNGGKDIKNLRWFLNVDWIGLYQRNVRVPFVPSCRRPDDLSNFSEENIKEIHIPQAPKPLFPNTFKDF